VQALVPQMSEFNLQENHVIDKCKEEEYTVSTQEIAARREQEDGTFDTFIGSLDRQPCPSANREQTRGKQPVYINLLKTVVLR
jgi:hypothetical protein